MVDFVINVVSFSGFVNMILVNYIKNKVQFEKWQK
jgi:hypothetical protein